MSCLADRVLAILESVTDKRVAAELVVTFVEMATKAELLAQAHAVEERERTERREAERTRKAAYRERLSRDVPGTDGDSQGQTGTGRDTVPPAPPSVLSLSLSSDPDPERAIPTAPPPARATKKRQPIAPPAYTEEFETFWVASGIGSKAEAFAAWEQVGKPAFEGLTAAWRRWQTIAWVDGFGVPHVSTWLRKFDWREEPKPRPRLRAGPPLERGSPLPPAVKAAPKTAPQARGWNSGGVP